MYAGMFVVMFACAVVLPRGPIYRPVFVGFSFPAMADDLRDRIRAYAYVAGAFSPVEKSEVPTLTEIIKAHLVEDAHAFARRAQGASVLMAHSHDGAPLTAMKHYRAKLSGSNFKVRREGALTSDFLVHQENLRYYDSQRSAPDPRFVAWPTNADPWEDGM